MPIPNHTIPEQFKQAVQIYFLIYNSVNRFNILIKGPVLKENSFYLTSIHVPKPNWLKSENSAKWFGIGTHSLDFLSNKTYECTFKDRKKVPLNRLSIIIAELESQCYGTDWLQWSIGVEIFVHILITVFCLLYRRRHDIRYFFLKLKLNRQRLTEMYNKKTYLFSAFVSSDHRDSKYFVYRKLLPNLETEETEFKFCVAQRNFLVGATILDNVMRAIHKSKKVIFIISQYFLQSKWCQEELLIAHQVRSYCLLNLLGVFLLFDRLISLRYSKLMHGNIGMQTLTFLFITKFVLIVNQPHSLLNYIHEFCSIIVKCLLASLLRVH